MAAMQAALIGAGGRMGKALIRALAEHRNGAGGAARLCGALARQGSPLIGRDAGEWAQEPSAGVKITDNLPQAAAAAQALIDFSAPALSLEAAAYAAGRGIAHIIGTTGFSAAQERQLAAYAKKTAIVKSGNMSLGVNALAELVRRAAAALGEAFDIEILEMHHRNKADAPSGTALLLAEAAAKGRKIDLAKHGINSRSGHTGARPAGGIGFASLRGGTVAGEHSVIFAGAGERLTLSHSAEDRSIFAEGAIKAALWAQRRKPGLYSMADVLAAETPRQKI